MNERPTKNGQREYARLNEKMVVKKREKNKINEKIQKIIGRHQAERTLIGRHWRED